MNAEKIVYNRYPKISIGTELTDKPEPLPPRGIVSLARLDKALLHLLAVKAKAGEEFPRDIVIARQSSAEAQYSALVFFYKVRDGWDHPTARSQMKKVSKEETEKIIKWRREGVSKKEIARRLNRHVSTIYYVCKRNNV